MASQVSSTGQLLRYPIAPSPNAIRCRPQKWPPVIASHRRPPSSPNFQPDYEKSLTYTSKSHYQVTKPRTLVPTQLRRVVNPHWLPSGDLRKVVVVVHFSGSIFRNIIATFESQGLMPCADQLAFMTPEKRDPGQTASKRWRGKFNYCIIDTGSSQLVQEV